jgi:hypothetical protein
MAGTKPGHDEHCHNRTTRRLLNRGLAFRFECQTADLIRHCEERSDEAIHFAARRKNGLLRYARNDVATHALAFSRRDFARVMHDVALKKNRGRRKHRMRDAPAASRANDRKHTSKSLQVHRTVRRFLRNGVTAYNVLSPVTGLFCHRRLQVTTCKLDPSVGGTGPHDFAVRVGIARLAMPPASIASRFLRP